MDDSVGVVPAPVVPTPAQFGLDARIEVPQKATLGDTVPLTVHVTWTAAPHPWLLLPQNSPEGSKLVQVDLAMEQTRSVSGAVEKPEIQVQYKLLAKDTGLVQIPALHFDIPVKNGTMSLVTNSVTLQIGKPFPWIPVVGAGFFFLAFVCAFLFFRNRRKRKALSLVIHQQAVEKIHKDLETLRNRIPSAEPRGWMLELEHSCQEGLALLGPLSNEQTDAKQKLENAFAQARYGGGPRDSWENKEWLRLARSLMNFTQDNEDDHG
ncbi:MAG TPA: hypothetical protein VLM37_01890 [Fibrobacteraceae bacterium]|nr:hypothetical protein [Fibrobacteraceae bacterium]